MDSEYYEKDGKKYDRVTKIINYFQVPEISEWRARVGNKAANLVLKKTGVFGTMIDAAIRDNWKNPKVDKKSAESKMAISAWNSWLSDYSPTDIKFPETLFSDRLMVAGTPDFKIKKIIYDIKCSSSVKPVYFAQLGAYAHLLNEQVEDLIVLRLDKKTGMYECVKASSIGLSVDECSNMFFGILYYYRTYKQVQNALKEKGEINE